jgi:phosphoglycolate phosphatase-like HAD superfamily hydrolase
MVTPCSFFRLHYRKVKAFLFDDLVLSYTDKEKTMIKGILLDKDGTILDIDKTWVPVARRVCKALAEEYAPDIDPAELLQAIGIEGDFVNPAGSMAKGTNADIASDIMQVMRGYGKEIEVEAFSAKSEHYFNSFSIDVQVIPTVEDLPELLGRLKKKGLVIGLATADTLISAKNCLLKLNVLELFEYIGSDDGIIKPKPATEMMEVFCQKYGMQPSEVVMVGDTMTDMAFGRNTGAGVLIGIEKESSEVGETADYVISSVAELIDRDEKLIWER